MKKTIIEKKDSLIDVLIDDLKENEYDSKAYIYSLVREALRTRTLTDLKDMVNDNIAIQMED